MTVRNWALAVWLVALTAACARDESRLANFEETLAVASQRPGILVIEATLRAPRAAEEQPALTIEGVTTAAGALPRLRDDQNLGGLVELLDAEGEALWSMHYRPLAALDAGTLRLRAPLLPEARDVRLTEAKNQRLATRPIASR